MVNCNDFRTFKKEKDRMCDSFRNNEESCPLKTYHSGWGCLEYGKCCLVRIDFAIKAIQKWSDNHPYGAKQKEFLKMFPNVPIDIYTKTVNICPKYLDRDFNCAKQPDCSVCKMGYWLEEK